MRATFQGSWVFKQTGSRIVSATLSGRAECRLDVIEVRGHSLSRVKLDVLSQLTAVSDFPFEKTRQGPHKDELQVQEKLV